jgi:hypothetical protein
MNVIKRIKQAIDLNDLMIIGGLGMVGYGLSGISLYLAIGVTGGIILGLGILGAIRKGS